MSEKIKFVEQVLKENSEENLIAAKQIEDERKVQMNDTASTKSHIMRHLGDVPSNIYWAMKRRFNTPGYDCWQDRKFRHEFFKVFSKFRIAGKI